MRFASALLALLALLTSLTRGARRAGDARCPPCPAAFARDEARAARVAELVARGGDARLAGEARPRMCFAPRAREGITLDGAVLLDGSRDDRAEAARAAHFALHARDGAPGDAPRERARCAAWLARARDAEERGDALEARVARALGVDTPRGESMEARMAAYAARCR